MSPGLILFLWFSRRTKSGRGHAEGPEESRTNEVFPGLSFELLGDGPSDDEPGVGIDELCAGLGFGRPARYVFEQEPPGVRHLSFKGPQFSPDRLSLDVSRRACPVRQQLLDG